MTASLLDSIAHFIDNFCCVVEAIDANDVLRDINEDRGVSGFPEIRSVDMVNDELAERRKLYCSVLRNCLDNMRSTKLVETMSRAVSSATDAGEKHGPALLDDLVDGSEIETQAFLQKECESISALVRCARDIAPRGEKATSLILDKIEQVTRNWDNVAQPIQVSGKSRGIVHRPSCDLAIDLRNLAVLPGQQAQYA